MENTNETQEELTEDVSEFLLNQNAKDKAERIKKEIGELLK
jgi:UDP:flavonoid glycosyltransferase YjiC (YdhE family)